MSLLKRMFGEKSAVAQAATAAGFPDSAEPDEDSQLPAAGPGPREVVHVVLRETMRQHGIPSDWIELRTFAIGPSRRSPATLVSLVVRGGQDRLLSYAPAFQAAFREALLRFDPRVAGWLQGIAWEFADATSVGAPVGMAAAGEPPLAFAPEPTATPAADPAEAAPSEDELEKDLQALFAIRDAALLPLDKPGDTARS